MRKVLSMGNLSNVIRIQSCACEGCEDPSLRIHVDNAYIEITEDELNAIYLVCTHTFSEKKSAKNPTST